MPAIVVVSDVHLDHATYGVSRFDEGAEAVFASVEKAIAIRAAAWFFLGDLCDPDSGPVVFRCVQVLIEASQRLLADAVPAVFLAGNHDCAEDGKGTTTLSPLRPLVGKRTTVLFEQPGVAELPLLPRIVAFPFTSSSHPYDPVAWAKKEVEAAKDEVMTISHLAVQGVQPGEETKELPRGREVIFPRIETRRAQARIQGHYHRAQEFDPGDGGPPIVIVGSPNRLTFSEEHNDPSFLVMEV